MDFTQKLVKLQEQVNAIEKRSDRDKLSMIVFSKDLDKLIAAFIIATGAAAMGTKVSMFFTFWGTSALRDPARKARGKNLIEKIFGMMLPKGLGNLKLSNLNMAGIGAGMIRFLMRKKKVPSLPDMLALAEEMEVELTICEMSMGLMGLKKEEMVEYSNLRYSGVVTFLKDAGESFSTLFI